MLFDRVLLTMSRHGMIRPSDRILVAVSGGADSVALLGLLVQLRHRGVGPFGRIELVVGHVNHGLRDDAHSDEEFCRELAASLRLPFASSCIDVTGKTLRDKMSIEDSARWLRYRALDALAQRMDCQKVALGHTEDDQAETFLLRLLRGAGTKGLASAYPVVGARFVRPLLEIRREELRAWGAARKLPFREDPSNRDPRFSRNRLRQEVMPKLVQEFNPRLVSTLASSASLFRDEEDFLDSLAKTAWANVRRDDPVGAGDDITLSVSALGELHVALQRRVVRLCLERLRGDLRGIHRQHVEGVLSLFGPSKSGRELHLPGVRVERSFDELVFGLAPAHERRSFENGYNRFEYHLTIPARVRVFECGGTLVATRDDGDGDGLRAWRDSADVTAGGASNKEVATRDANTELRASGDSVVVAVPEHSEIFVRSPRASDRFRPLGAPGGKKLSRYLMERKVARRERLRVPLVICRSKRGFDGAGREDVLWVVGHGVSEAARLRSGAQRLRLAWSTEGADPL